MRIIRIGDKMYAQGRIVREVERRIRVNDPVAVGGVDVDGHIAILAWDLARSQRRGTARQVSIWRLEMRRDNLCHGEKARSDWRQLPDIAERIERIILLVRGEKMQP
jgi:hypothetical protein